MSEGQRLFLLWALRHLTQSMLEYIETLPSCTCGSGKCQRHDLRKALERIMSPGNGRDVLR